MMSQLALYVVSGVVALLALDGVPPATQQVTTIAAALTAPAPAPTPAPAPAASSTTTTVTQPDYWDGTTTTKSTTTTN